MNSQQSADAERLVGALVSRRCGLVSEIAPQSRGPDEPCPPHLWTATLAHYDFQNAARSDRLNAGKGRSEDEAKLSALGEAIERYSAYHWDDTRVRVDLAAENAITPADCVLHSPAQYTAGLPYPQWSPEVQTSWIEGVELPGHTPVDLPAAFVYLVSPTPRPEDHVTAITSNGLAAGPDLNGAILGGLYEVIERDALMITWLNKLPATEIEAPEAGCYSAEIIRHYAYFGVKVRLVSNPPGQGAARLIGMGCDLDPVAAVDKAVFELCQARPSMNARLQSGDPADRLKGYEDIADLDDHPLFHAIPANLHEFDFLFAGKERLRLDQMARPEGGVEEALETVVAAATTSGARVAYVDITTPDIAPLGPRVVRTFVTGLQPIHFGYGQGRFGGRRVFDAPVAWGYRETPLAEADLNPCPHPLA